jgi:hypothetical protein
MQRNRVLNAEGTPCRKSAPTTARHAREGKQQMSDGDDPITDFVKSTARSGADALASRFLGPTVGPLVVEGGIKVINALSDDTAGNPSAEDRDRAYTQNRYPIRSRPVG